MPTKPSDHAVNNQSDNSWQSILGIISWYATNRASYFEQKHIRLDTSFGSMFLTSLHASFHWRITCARAFIDDLSLLASESEVFIIWGVWKVKFSLIRLQLELNQNKKCVLIFWKGHVDSYRTVNGTHIVTFLFFVFHAAGSIQWTLLVLNKEMLPIQNRSSVLTLRLVCSYICWRLQFVLMLRPM
jgi:hypothetical protein